MEKTRLLQMYKQTIKTMKADLEKVSSPMSREVIQERIDTLEKQYAFSKTFD